MKKFVFALESVLELKRRREEALLEELAKRVRAVNAAAQVLTDLREERRRVQIELRELLRGRVEVCRVRESQDYLAGVDGRILQQQAVVRRLNEEVKACRQRVIAATQERKALEKLRERQWQTYRQESLREEQTFLDELATQGYARLDRVAEPAGCQTGSGL